MNDDLNGGWKAKKVIRTYSRIANKGFKPTPKPPILTPVGNNEILQAPLENQVSESQLEAPQVQSVTIRNNPVFLNKELCEESLSTKKSVEFLLDGTLSEKVCRYCLKIKSKLSGLDQILQVAGKGVLYKVSIRVMVATFHPFKVTDDPNFPNKICDQCLDRTISAYLFSQQCEQSERALLNAFRDIYEKVEKLDPIERPRKPGRQKLKFNHNVIHVEHEKVTDYAEPIINLVNIESTLVDELIPKPNKLECPKCWQAFPNIEMLVNHKKKHPSFMWCHCRVCGKSFAKQVHLNRHMQSHLNTEKSDPEKEDTSFKCQTCDFTAENCNDFLQHMQKHKFQATMENLIERKMDKLCAVCFDKETEMIGMDKVVKLSGGIPALKGNKSVLEILSNALSDMNFLQYTRSKICMKCYKKALITYTFINHSYHVRNKLSTCVSLILENLNNMEEPKSNLIVEIAVNDILPIKEDYEDLLLDADSDVEDSKLKVEVLEDEFRIESDNESLDSEDYSRQNVKNNKTETKVTSNGFKAKTISELRSLDNICGEFLTFKKKNKMFRRPYKYKFTCPLCNKYFISCYFLKNHLLKHVYRKTYCKFCGEQFKSQFCLREHVKMVHLLKSNNFRSCQICGRSFVNDKKLLSHGKTHFKKECLLCGKFFLFQKHYDIHLKRHALKYKIKNRKRTLNCSFCEKEYSNKNKLSVHVNKVHLQIKAHSCDMCENRFYTEHGLRNHKKIHSLFSKESCELCSKKFKCRKHLVVHIRKHMGLKPFSCQICGENFYTEQLLRRHIRSYHRVGIV